MDDDPEKRISDLERGLAQPRAAEVLGEFTTSDRLTAEEVHTVAFSKPALFKRGYNEDEVDALLERVEATLRDPTAKYGPTSADLHNVVFSKPPIGKRGYNEDEVNAFLDRVKIEFARSADRAISASVSSTYPQPQPLEGWGFVAFGGEGFVESAFVGDVRSALLGSGLFAARHHQPATSGGV